MGTAPISCGVAGVPQIGSISSRDHEAGGALGATPSLAWPWAMPWRLSLIFSREGGSIPSPRWLGVVRPPWSFWTTSSFEEAILTAANLGDDADTTAAVCGQVAGAYYGRSGIPERWLERVWEGERIGEVASGGR